MLWSFLYVLGVGQFILPDYAFRVLMVNDFTVLATWTEENFNDWQNVENTLKDIWSYLPENQAK